MNMSHRLNSDVPWMVVAWVILIASGASTSGLLRASVGIAGVGSAMLTAHIVSGAALGGMIVNHLLRRHTAQLWPVAWIGATIALGWLASRAFAPVVAAGHAAVAAYAIVALAGIADAAPSPVANSQPPRSWKGAAARVGFVLLLVQIALGALLRHHLISIVWHVFTGGLAALAILVPAVAITQDAPLSGERHAARWAITSVLVQVSLGVAVLFMILVGTPGVLAWVATTVSHVVIGAVTLLAAARLARVLRTGRSPASDRSVGVLP
jgi:hypothetical protein